MGFLIKPIAFGALILAGYLLRQKGFCNDHDQKALSKLVLNVTLPAAVIHSFYGFERDPSPLSDDWFGVPVQSSAPSGHICPDRANEPPGPYLHYD